jgi:hypothetical protein
LELTLGAILKTHLSPGDHLAAERWPHDHHGIYVGEGLVVHYTGPRKRDGTVRVDTLEVFARGHSIKVIRYPRAFPGQVVVDRAYSRLGEAEYNLIFENCEHFACWCKTGKSKSQQVRTAAASAGGVGGGVGATAAALGTVAGIGEAAGLSGGAGLMHGLRVVGGTVGGGSALGLGALTVGPAVVTAVAVNHALADDPDLSDDERSARAVGRIAGAAGAAAGTATAVGAVATLGVPGLGAIGMTTGLAQLGTVVGGGMFAGIGVAVALPMALGGGLAFVAYRALRRRRTVGAAL